LDIVDVPKFTVAENSLESELIAEKYLRIVPSTIGRSLPILQSFGSAEDYIISSGIIDSNLPTVPQLEDIQSLDPEEYFENGIQKAKVIIRVKNSIGQKLKGIDARLEITASSGGTA
jgi:hypothetical protein